MRLFFPLVLITCFSFGLSACNSSSSSSSSGSVATAACADGIDNDNDGLTDYPDDPGCANANDANEVDPPTVDQRLTRYQMANSCWALKANGNGKYVTVNGGNYEANADDTGSAEHFYLKPTRLGSYMFYNSSRLLMTAGDASDLVEVASAEATDNSEWTVLAEGDTTEYPPTPVYNQEPVKNSEIDEVALWHDFVDPEVRSKTFTLTSEIANQNLAVNNDGTLVTVDAGSNPSGESFTFEPVSTCAEFPEAQSNFSGEPFKGTQPDGSVLGHADVHVHISATEFLGGGHWGYPFHKFGVEHALGSCADKHGPNGYEDFIGGAYTQDVDGHATDGWPTFSDWPSRDNLTHEAIYWKWLERAWAGGLRVVVNDLVDNETLCELQRNAIGDPTRDCNSMNNAGEQAGTMYAMENYIDAQYGGPGKGFFQIVHTPEEARSVIEDGKIAVILGIEISNLFDCKITYSPTRALPPEQEPGDEPLSALENHYGCTEESLVEQMQRVHAWGVRQIISIHEFDNAFGGNGIFDGLLLNVGNRENSGGMPSGDMSAIVSAFEEFAGFNPEQADTLNNLASTETPTGEWWTTYNCPEEVENPQVGDFSGYLWSGSGGSAQTFPSQANQVPGLEYINVVTGLACTPSGQHGRPGGSTPCYPVAVNQCNARWMTPIGLFAYQKMMELGFIIDWDHMSLGMKTQLLELAEAQNPVYPFASTHGTFGGITNDQAKRMLANGGFLYPSNGNSVGFINDMKETAALHDEAASDLLFGFGYGTDTNGLSAQSSPSDTENDVTYPFTLFNNAEPFNTTQFTGTQPVVFSQPNSTDVDGTEIRKWDEEVDGNAHYGMLSDFIEEVILDSDDPVQHVKYLFNSAEAYLRTWERTVAASSAIQDNGIQMPSQEKPILRPAPNTTPSAAVYGDPTSYCDAIGESC